MARAHLERFPFPLAQTGHRLRSARTASDRLDQAQHVIETTATMLGLLTIAWCHAHGQSNQATEKWEAKIEGKGHSLGDWTTMLKSTFPLLLAGSDSLGRAVGLAAQTSLPRLDGFTQTRNRFAHGGRPREAGDRSSAADELSHRVDVLFDSMESLQSVRMAVVRDRVRQNQDAIRSDLDVFIGTTDGGHRQQLSSRRTFETGSVIAYCQGQLDSAAVLSPYVLHRTCPECGRDELFYLSKRKRGRAEYLTFATGHEMRLNRDDVAQKPQPLSALGLQPISARRTESAQGWRAEWRDLAPRHIRFAARALDLSLAMSIGTLFYLLAWLVGLPGLHAALVALAAGLVYEPAASLTGGTGGKRLLRIEAISVWDSRPLSTRELVARAALIDLQILLFPLAIRTAAWILWDPARQGLADRQARSVVIQGRSLNAHKV